MRLVDCMVRRICYSAMDGAGHVEGLPRGRGALSHVTSKQLATRATINRAKWNPQQLVCTNHRMSALALPFSPSW